VPVSGFPTSTITSGTWNVRKKKIPHLVYIINAIVEKNLIYVLDNL